MSHKQEDAEGFVFVMVILVALWVVVQLTSCSSARSAPLPMQKAGMR